MREPIRNGARRATIAYAKDCDFVVATNQLDRPFQEVGVLDFSAPSLNAGISGRRSVSEFKEAIQPLVCEAGGDAVIAEVNGGGEYVRGTVVRWREANAHDAGR